MTGSALFPASRLGDVAASVRAAGLDALLLTPGADLKYVTGYDAKQLERLTCLVVPAGDRPLLVVPRLELAAAKASPASGLGLEIIPWDETEDPYALIAARLGPVAVVGLADQMWALMVLSLRDALPSARQVLASSALRELRMRKSPAEVGALREAGAAIDRVHERVPGWLKAGRTERQVGTLIAEAILEEGHTTVDFVIVGSGPNAASPHHELSDRILQPGDAVVVDIGGAMPSGYRSDCTRTYAIGEPPAEFTAYYRVLKDAQDAACEAVRPGVRAGAVDAAAREPITAAGYGDAFIHRTGHGIGLESHEAPYIVAGNTEPLRPGMAFSIEPGIYPGPHGARIEDIVVCTENGCERLNNVTRELVIVDGLQVGRGFAASLLLGQETLELRRQLVRGRHLAVAEQAVAALVGRARLGQGVVLPLQRGDQLGHLLRLRDLPLDLGIGALGRHPEGLFGQVQVRRGADRAEQGQRRLRVDGLGEIVRHVNGEAHGVPARLAQPQLDQRGGAARHLKPVGHALRVGDQLGSGRVADHAERPGVRHPHGDAVEPDHQAAAEPGRDRLDGRREQLPLVVGLGPGQQQERRARRVVQQPHGQLGRLVLLPVVGGVDHRRAP
jgi:Xaa-Pro aminopeptidase